LVVVLTAAGILVIGIGLVDMFHTLLHPSGRGRLSRLVVVTVWKLSGMFGHRLGSAAGPAGMTAAVLLWIILQGVGWALIYYPHVPGGFTYAAGINPFAYNRFAEALYISLVSLATLGYGDVVATDPWIRLAAPLEALAGFALLTAALTWFTQIYPPLSRRRALAVELKGLADNRYADSMDALGSANVSRVLDNLAGEVAKIRIDFSQHAEGYYFREHDPELSLARQLSYALVLRDRAALSSSAEVRLSGNRLGHAMDQLGKKLQQDFLTSAESADAAVAAYAEDHGQTRRT
jgi:voltage-gated potassium channel Kch